MIFILKTLDSCPHMTFHICKQGAKGMPSGVKLEFIGHFKFNDAPRML